jgi:glycosyltransferase involved in cell wall biosynthesis
VRYPDHHRQERLNAPAQIARRVPADRAKAPQHAPASPLRTLHVAALPFPSPQGTQAAIDAMLRALARAGRDPQLLTYAAGLQRRSPPPYKVHCGPSWVPASSLRSGPSFQKLLADVALASRLEHSALRGPGGDRARPGTSPLVIAHHVEAALVTWRTSPAIFFAHTDLGEELPTYAPAWLSNALRGAGVALDRMLVQHAAAVATVSPLLCERMAVLAGARAARVHYVPIPWSLPSPITAGERAEARLRFASSARTPLVAYLGNLDGYQGWEALIAALAQLNRRGPAVQLLVATASDPAPLWREARSAALSARVTVVPLAGEAMRRAVHAAADLVLIPRRAPGGLPIKLLDGLARGVPCVLAASARAGLPLADAAEIAAGDDAAALAAAIDAVLAQPAHAHWLRAAGRAYIAADHSDDAFATAFDHACSLALASSARSRSDAERR